MAPFAGLNRKADLETTLAKFVDLNLSSGARAGLIIVF